MTDSQRSRSVGSSHCLSVRCDPIGLGELTRCSLVIALTNMTPPPRELVSRWRRTLISGAAIGAYSVVLVAGLGLPLYLGLILAWATFLFAYTYALVLLGMLRRRSTTMWRTWRGLDGAVCIIEWSPKRQRYEAHSWAAFRRHRHLGGPVAQAAISQGPRPLWIEPALPTLRTLYRARYGFVDDRDSRWMYLADPASMSTMPEPR